MSDARTLRQLDTHPARADPGHPLAWGVVGVVAQVVFTAGWVIAETWQGPRYSPITNTISDLQARTAPHVWFPILCFAAGAVGTFGFAVFGLRPRSPRRGRLPCSPRGCWRSPRWRSANSFPLIPCRLPDPGCTANVQLLSPGGLTDAIVAGLAFLVLALTPFPLGRRLAALPSWRPPSPVWRLRELPARSRLGSRGLVESPRRCLPWG